MSDLATPSFLPWLRTGLASSITAQAQDGLATGSSADVTVTVKLLASGTGSDIDEMVQSPLIRLRAPGEVVGIDPALIMRHDPEIGTDDAESNYLALIEFSDPDFPWRYTPAVTSTGRLQPWIALVVVEERAGIALETGTSNRLPVLNVDDVAGELPDLSQSWAWAHVQADIDVSQGAAAAFGEAPDAFRSRLLCPRHLLPDRSWLACVVPVFETGRLAGLGEPIATDKILAWDTAAGGVLRLPVYHFWRFQTGRKGDIESLVRRLKPRELPETVGRRDLDISSPGGGLPAVKNSLISYQGALVSLLGQPRLWPAAQRQHFISALSAILNADQVQSPPPAAYDALRDDPVVGPPAYAVQQAGRRVVPPEGSPPVWFGELATEPQNRTVAGLGAAVIRKDQEPLMAKAWEYASGAVEARQVLTRSRTAWEVAQKSRERFAALSDELLVQICAPAMARLRYSSELTLKGALAGSALPQGLLSGAFRRLTHNVGGFVKTTPLDRIPTTGAITRQALDQTLDFVGHWATVKSPLNADVDEVEAPSARTAAAKIPQTSVNPSKRVQVIITPYSGDITPVLSLAEKTASALDPQGTIKAMVEARITGLSPERDQDVPDRVFVRPQFTSAMYHRLVSLSVEYMVPGVGDIPNNTLGLLATNPPFIEAFLAGLNDEMGREFLWREYPARLSDTWFQYFWEGGAGASADILAIRSWQEGSGLGTHAPKGTVQAGLVLLIRSVILRRYPDLRVYAVEAAWKEQNGQNIRVEATKGAVKTPLFAARLASDIGVYGFDLQEDQARGSTNPHLHPGYFIVLEQQPGSPRFGLDIGSGVPTEEAPKLWSNLSWSHLGKKNSQEPSFIDVQGPDWLVSAGALPSNSDDSGAKGKDTWGEDAAAMARITFQRPIRMLVHADSMLPGPSAAP